MTEKYIALIGAANMDIHGFSSNEIINKDSNPGIIGFSPGGVSRNIAENLSRLGIKTELISAMGEDPNGKLIIESCRECGIGVDYSITFPDKRSSVYLAIMDPSNDMALALSDMTISDSITVELMEERFDILNNAEAIVFDTCLPAEVMDYILSTFSKKTIYIDPVSIGKSKALKPLIPKVHTLKMNKMEAEFLSGREISEKSSLEQTASWFLDKGVKRVFITLGKDGTYYSNGTIFDSYKPEPAEIKNATGAGDAFMAGLVYGTLKGYNLDKIVRFATGVSLVALQGESTVNSKMSLKYIEQISGENFND